MPLFSDDQGLGILEYILIIILVFLIIFTLVTLFWPAFQLFYESTLQELLG
jgi:hypothetical protein